MNYNPKIFKRSAINTLSGKWLNAISYYFVFYLIRILLSSLFQSVTYQYNSLSMSQMIQSPSLFLTPILILLLQNIFILFLLAPFEVGLNKVWIKLTKKEPCSFFAVISNPERWLTILKTIGLKFLILLSFAIIPVICVIKNVPYAEIISLIFAIPCIKLYLDYAMVSFILAEEPNLSCTNILRKSKQMMKGHIWHYINLSISFLPWIILVSMILGIGFIFLDIYIMVSVTYMYHQLKHEHSLDVMV